MILWMFFGKFRKFPQKCYIMRLYEKCTSDKLQIIENRQKMQKITNFDLSLKNYAKKKSKKIQGHSWGCY